MAGKVTQKALAISSAIGSVIKMSEIDNQKLALMNIRINKAMKVYSAKDNKSYHEVMDKFYDIWHGLRPEYGRQMENNQEIGKFIEYLCHTLSANTFKVFLGLKKYEEPATISEETEDYLRRATLALELKLNEVFGTKPYTEQITMGGVKIKKKPRDKSKKKPKTQVVSSSKVKEGQRRKNVRSFLRDRIEQAKEIK